MELMNSRCGLNAVLTRDINIKNSAARYHIPVNFRRAVSLDIAPRILGTNFRDELLLFNPGTAGRKEKKSRVRIKNPRGPGFIRFRE